MKALKTLLFVTFVPICALCQPGEIEKAVGPFTRVAISTHFNVILQQGEEESVKIVYDRVSPDMIHVDLSGSTLRLYLDGARMVDKWQKVRINGRKHKWSVYRDVNITAYVTYRQLEQLSVKGEEQVVVNSDLSARKFKLKAYGEAEIELASLKADKAKTVMYGANRVKIKAGNIGHQKLKLFGENIVDTRSIETQSVATTIWGESLVKARVSSVFHLSALGEPRVHLYGNAIVTKGIILGEASIQRGM